MILHSAWRASAPYRVRIALNLKGVPYDYAPVNLLAGQQKSTRRGWCRRWRSMGGC